MTVGWLGARRLVVLSVIVTVLSGCAFHGLGFVRDDRVSIVTPHEREEVQLPVTIDWTATASVADGARSFAVLLDRAPPPPGRTVEWLFRNDDACAMAAACEDASYLADRGVYLTSATEVTVARIPALAAEGRHDFHEATVVLLDGDGARAGESAWSVEFELVDEA